MLEVAGLSCMAGFRPLFSNLHLQLDAGQWLMLSGPNGTGKTSLLRALAGLVRPAAGEIRWQAQPVKTNSTGWRNTLHYLGHSAALKDTLSARENLRYWLALDTASAPASDSVDDLLEQVGLSRRGDLPVARLSAGQRKRVQLARLMASTRALWLLDEPGNALDSDGGALLGKLLDQHLTRGGCAVVATHQPLELHRAPQLLEMTRFAANTRDDSSHD